MSIRAVVVKDIGKRYHLGRVAGSYNTLRESLVGLGRGRREPKKESFWALRDISFELSTGEVLGVIGRNGAGKSTLLKILSRITSPTTGSARMQGRVGALLEVGTGFHPELTGRENIYLNGSILGMSRKDIGQQFDQIVEFAELPAFLDLPVKRYSSGMYVRLAFAVAAHLEPEILLVDEVLAVGDYRFQSKCLGRMGEMSKEGRTVIFVSHAMNAIQALCTRAIVLEAGRLIRDGTVEEAVGAYTRLQGNEPDVWNLALAEGRQGRGQIKLTRFWVSEDGHTPGALRNGHPAHLNIGYEVEPQHIVSDVAVTVVVKSQLGSPVFYHHNLLTGRAFDGLKGKGVFRLRIPKLPLRQGVYVLDLHLSQDSGRTPQDVLLDAVRMEVVDGNFFGTGADYSGGSGAPVLVDGAWSVDPSDEQPSTQS